MTILNQYEIVTYGGGMFFIFAFLFLILSMFSFGKAVADESIVAFFVSAISALTFLGLVLRGAYLQTKPVPTGRCGYEVVLEDDYPFTDIYEKYIVVKQRGDIWVLEEKEVVENEQDK